MKGISFSQYLTYTNMCRQLCVAAGWSQGPSQGVSFNQYLTYLPVIMAQYTYICAGNCVWQLVGPRAPARG